MTCLAAVLVVLLSVQDFVQEGWKAVDGGEFVLAEVRFRTALARDKENGEAHAGLGVALCRRGKYGRGLESLKRARELKSTYAHLDLELGRAYFMTDEPDKALPALEAYRAAHPEVSETYEILGLCRFNAGQYEQAIEAFSHPSLRGRTETEAMILYHLGAAHEALGRTEKAEPYLNDLFKKYPDTPYARRARGVEVADDRDLWARMRARPLERFWTVFGGVEGQFDTNPLSIGEDALVPGALSDRQTWNLQVHGGAGFRIVHEADAVWNVEARHAANWHDGLSTFDQNLTVISTYGEYWFEGWIGAYGGAGWGRLRVGGDDTRETWNAGAGLLFVERPWMRTRVSFSHMQSSYFIDGLPRPQDLDGQSDVVGIAQEMVVPDTDLHLAIGYSRAFVDTDGSDYDANVDRVVVQASHEIAWDVRATLALSWTGSDYLHGNSRDAAGRARRDDAWAASLRVERPLCDFATVYLSATLIDNSSRLGVFDYDRNLYAFGIDFRY